MIPWSRRLARVSLVVAVVSAGCGGIFLLLEGPSRRSLRFLLAAVLLFGVHVVLDPRSIWALVSTRRARFGSFNAVASVLVLLVLALLNVAAIDSRTALDLSWDHLNTLAPDSIRAAQGLQDDLLVTGFYSSDQDASRRDAETLLSLYEAHSDHLKVLFEDPHFASSEIQQMGVTADATLVLQYRQRRTVLPPGSQTERDLTGAMLRLEAAHGPTVCWAVGDSERDLSDQAPRGYFGVRDLIGRLNYELPQNVFLTGATELPKACSLLAIVGPKQPLSDQAVALVNAYLNGGGRLLLAVDPWSELESENRILAPYGAAFSAGLVVESGGADHVFSQDGLSPVVMDYTSSPLTNDVAPGPSLFPLPTRVAMMPVAGTTTVAVASSSRQAYEVPTPRPPDQVTSPQPRDRRGSFPLLVTVERPSSKTRMVLVGSAAFAENQVLSHTTTGSGNIELIQASLRWLAGDDSPAAVPRRTVSRSRELRLPPDALMVNFVITLLILPGLVVVTAAVGWSWRGRGRAKMPESTPDVK